jgi:hypothetical protein
MEIIPNKYTFTDADRVRVEALGYHIEGIPPDERLETFIATMFPDFDLASVLELVDRMFAPTTSLPIRRHIHYNVPKKILHFIFENNTDVLDETVAFDRVISWLGGEIVVEHRYCLVPLPYQGKGLIKLIFQESLQQYVNMGVRKIRVHARFAGGGYTWARHGFVAINRSEVESILDMANKTLAVNEMANVERIFKKYYSDHPDGTDFPMELWARLLSNFSKYVWRS